MGSWGLGLDSFGFFWVWVQGLGFRVGFLGFRGFGVYCRVKGFGVSGSSFGGCADSQVGYE